eukprot:1006233-Rhodomonas_salina.3
MPHRALASSSDMSIQCAQALPRALRVSARKNPAASSPPYPFHLPRSHPGVKTHTQKNAFRSLTVRHYEASSPVSRTSQSTVSGIQGPCPQNPIQRNAEGKLPLRCHQTPISGEIKAPFRNQRKDSLEFGAVDHEIRGHVGQRRAAPAQNSVETNQIAAKLAQLGKLHSVLINPNRKWG